MALNASASPIGGLTAKDAETAYAELEARFSSSSAFQLWLDGLVLEER